MEKPGRKDQQELRQSVFRALRATEHSPYSSSATRLLGQQKLVSPLSLLETWREIFQFVGINLLLLCSSYLQHQLCDRHWKNAEYKKEGTKTVIMDLTLPAANCLENYLRSHKCGHYMLPDFFTEHLAHTALPWTPGKLKPLWPWIPQVLLDLPQAPSAPHWFTH